MPLVIVDKIAGIGTPQHEAGYAAGTAPLVVQQNVPVPRSLIITDAHLLGGRSHRGSTSVSAMIVTGVGALSALDPVSALNPGTGLAADSMASAQPKITRGSLQVMDSPKVTLRGYEIRSVSGKNAPRGIAIARTERSAKVMVQEAGGGEYFALADRIHYHAGSHTFILEGSVIFRCGAQTIKARNVLMKLDPVNRRVECAGSCTVTE